MALSVLLPLLSGCSSGNLTMPSLDWLPSPTDWFSEEATVDQQISSAVSNGSSGCVELPAEALRKINWTRVPEIDIRVRNDEFEPMVITLRQGWPYIMTIHNRDFDDHGFHAPEFFESVSVIMTTIDGQRASNNCYDSVTVPPRKSAAIRLIAAVDGHYEFNDSSSIIPGFAATNAIGVINIELREDPLDKTMK